MTKTHDIILKFATEHNGFVTTRDLEDIGKSRSALKKLVDDGRLERSTRGVYVLPEVVFDDEYYNAQVRFQNGIFSLNTALFLQDLSVRTPLKYDIVLPYRPSSRSISHKINLRYERDEYFGVGEIQVKTPCGNFVNVYSPERTLCDIVRPINAIDTQIVVDAFREYVSRTNKNINQLIKYAKLLKVEEKVRTYMEAMQ